MNTKNLLITLGAVTVAVLTLNLSAQDAALSPRAAGNRVIHTTGQANSITVVTAATVAGVPALSPRAAGNQHVAVAGTEVAVKSCPVIGSPKYIGTAGAAARTSCCNLTLAECPSMDKMPKAQ